MADSLAEALAMMLPPGLLFDSPEIYAEVAKLPIVPLEDVRRHWYGMHDSKDLLRCSLNIPQVLMR